MPDGVSAASMGGGCSCPPCPPTLGGANGAGDGIRTRDNQLGKLGLYQLSYARIINPHGEPV